MRIKRLELVGFKSFVDPTVIDFDAPIVGVVGPNGCGKSNVVDAIRWVMGEMSAKSLRGRAMEDVIFNGSEKRPPLGMAEVSLTFSTDDGIAPADYAGFTEITVTRRLYRSGDSEYLINKVPSRLRDVIDLFLGTGVGHRAYSVIEQGKIDYVISAKPEDRRLLIEEAAGVSKFKARKEAALRKMEGTEQNLARLKDIFNEVNRQISSLDRQVKKAERYKILKNEFRELDVKLASLHYLELSREVTELKALLDDWNLKETASFAELSTVDSDLERGRLELVEKDREFNTLQEKFFEVSSRLQLLEAQEGFQKKEKEGLIEAKRRALLEIDEIKERLATLKLEKEDQEKKRTAIDGNDRDAVPLETAEKEFSDIEAAREEVLKKIELLKEEGHQIASQLVRLEGEKRLFDERKGGLRGQVAGAEVEQAESKRRLEEQRVLLIEKIARLEEVTQRSQSLKREIEDLKAEIASRHEKKEILAQEVDIRREELVLKRSRLKSLLDLERNFEGYEEGVRSILKTRKDRGRDEAIFGVVADFIETAPEYEMAVSAALGEKLQYVIVKSHETGVEAINYLKTESSGRSSFIPMEVRDSMNEDFPYHGHRGVVGPLLERVRLKQGYHRIGQYLLGDVVLVESLHDALSLWQSNGHKKTLVTLEGEVVDPFGVVSGGTTGIRGKILLEKKREINELKVLTAELEDEIGLKEDALSQLEGNLSELALNLEQSAHRSHEEELKRMALETEQTHQGEEFRRFEKELLEHEAGLAQLAIELEKTGHLLTQTDSRRSELYQIRQEKDREILAFEETLGDILQRTRQSQERLTALRVQAAGSTERKAMAEREFQRLLEIEEELHQRIGQKMAAITDAHQKMNLTDKSMETSSLETATLKKLADELAVSQESRRTEYERQAQALQEKEARVRELRKENDLARSHTGDLRVTLSRAETDLGHLEQQILEKYSVSLNETASTYSGVEINKAEEEARLAELKERLDRLGDVNLAAIPEYEELRTRHEFLSRQIEDLENSLAALKKAIHRINQTTKKRFEETFAMVNERFQTLFPRLFQGGRAELRLSQDHQDLFQSGVELLVQPPGKKLSHIGLLSGGEKAMAAVAFIFSIFLVKPSPFCILDEVDAPLDDLNTERFHRLLSEMVNRTQFILITHNRRTMEKADLLYGVTMQEPGVSQLVSVRLSESLKLAS